MAVIVRGSLESDRQSGTFCCSLQSCQRSFREKVRRQMALYLEELEQFRQIRPGNARDIEEFADLLDIAMINIQEAGQRVRGRIVVHQAAEKIATSDVSTLSSLDLRKLQGRVSYCIVKMDTARG